MKGAPQRSPAVWGGRSHLSHLLALPTLRFPVSDSSFHRFWVHFLDIVGRQISDF